jgi:pilus assembly protein CpaC
MDRLGRHKEHTMEPKRTRSRQITVRMALACAVASAVAWEGPVAAQPAVQSAAQPAPEATAGVGLPPLMTLALGKSQVLRLTAPAARVSVGNPQVADVILLSPAEFYVVAKAVGTTNVLLWTKAGQVAATDITVSVDTAGLQEKLAAVLTDEPGLTVQVAGESLVLTGTVSSSMRVDKAVELANAYAGKKVLNFLQVGTPQQVMLEVKVAEINRTLAEKLGLDFSGALTSSGGAWTRTLSGLLGGGNAATLAQTYNSTQKVAPFTPGAFQAPSGVLQPTVTNLATPDFAQLVLNAQKTDGLIKILAEPTIVAINGQEGSFLAGGEVMIPVPQPGGTTILQSKQFGVELRFTPTVLESGTIAMRVSSAVSALVGFSPVATTGLGGAVLVPTLTSRHVSTTVQLREGQSLAIGGLLQDNYRSNIQRFPILGEIPLLGVLFRSSDYQKNKTELLIVVTPRLSKALQGAPKLPTDSFHEPGRARFLLGGQMEGPAPAKPATAPQQPQQPQPGAPR